ncbi:MAG: sensor histidine kinase [Pseudomonadota bacterium]
MLQTTVSLAQPAAVQLDGPKSAEELRPFISYYLDSGWERTVSEMLNEYKNEFKPIETSAPDFGYTKDKIWLRMIFENRSELEEDWRIHFKENFKQLFDVYVARENFSIENVLSQDLERGFKTRSVQYPELVAPVTIEPGETVTVLVNYWSEGASYIQLTMETGPSFADIAAKRTAKNFIYYGMMILLIAAALIALVVYRHVVFAAYIAYAASTLLFLMHSDGVAYQYLWPDLPKFNSIASIVTGSAIIIFASNYARVFLLTKNRYPLVDKMLLAIIVTTIIIDVSAFFVDNQIVKKVLVLMSLIAVIGCTTSGIVAARTRFKEVRFFLFAWLGILLASAIMNLRHWLGIEISQDFQYDFMRFVMVVDAAMMGLAIGDRYNQLRAARQLATQQSLDEAKRNLELTKRLGALEKKYTIAAEVAQSKDEQIANTIHDLRQPLHALRLSVGQLVDGKHDHAVEPADIEQTFAYLEDLVSGHLDHSGVAHSVDHSGTVPDRDEPRLSTCDVLRSVHDMFLPDARAKGLEFKYVPTSLEADVEHLVLMRIVTNLVSNAIKYTEKGKVLLGCRRNGKKLFVEVHDTGPGLDESEFELAKEREIRIEQKTNGQEGNGYGLAIVCELVQKHGLSLKRHLGRKGGTGFVLEVPVR